MIYSQSGWAIPNYWINSDLRLTSSNNYHMKLMGSKDLVGDSSTAPNYRYSVGLLAVEVKSTLLLQTLVLGLVPSLEGVNILHLFLVMLEILVR